MTERKERVASVRSRRHYSKPRLRKLGSFEAFTRTAGDVILQFDTPYPDFDVTTS